MNHHQANELLPCAHCGNEAIKTLQSGDERDGYAQRVQISCIVCGARIGTMGDTSKGGYADNSTVEARAIAAWNRRAPAPTSEPGARDAATYTCKGKGGTYSLLGQVYGAGTSRGQTVTLYEEVSTGVRYFRTAEDFNGRMERLATPASPAVPAPAPVTPSEIDVQILNTTPLDVQKSANVAHNAASPLVEKAATFQRGDIVRKKSGSEWEGVVVGFYSTTQTSEGYAVESSTHKGSVQIYPVSALELVEEAQLIVAGKVEK